MSESRNVPDVPASLQEDDVPGSAEQIVMEALNKGFVDPTLVLECIYYAAETDLLLLMRAFAGLDTPSRVRILNYAREFDTPERGKLRGN